MANEVNSLGISSQRDQRSERCLNICRPSKERVANARFTSLVRKNPGTVLKTAVDNAILELSESSRTALRVLG